MKSGGVLLLGLDGATWKLLDPWLEDYSLPALATLKREGVWGILNSTIPAQTCPALPTLFTGKNPGELGVFDYQKPNGEPITLTAIREKKIWNLLDREGLSSCIVNVRFTYPSEKVNGIMVSGSPVPSEESNYVFPPDLKKEIQGFRFDTIDQKLAELTKDPQRNRQEILNYRVAITKERYNFLKKLISGKDFDFIFYWIGGTDFMQHWFWNDKDALLRYFKEVDLIVLDMMRRFKNRDIILISDHGFEKASEYRFHTNTWLKQEGFLKSKGGAVMQLFLSSCQSIIRRYLSPAYIYKLLKLMNSKSKIEKDEEDVEDIVFCNKFFDRIPGVDWRNSEAYLMTSWGIQIKKGIKNKRYEEIRERIIDSLKKLRDDNQNLVVKNVWKREDIFSGKFLKQIPDIVFLPTEKYVADPQLSRNLFESRKGRAKEYKKGRFFQGDHLKAREGIIITWGKSIKKDFKIKFANLVDIIPTILHLMHCKIPEDLEGRVLKEIFLNSSDAYKRKVEFRRVGVEETEQGTDLSTEELEGMKEKLRGMGYL